MREEAGVLRGVIERRDWETLGLYLALGVVRTAAKYSPEVLEAMIDELVGELEAPPRPAGKRHGKGVRRIHRGRG